MSFTVSDYRDLLQLLDEHPEWREELRRALLSDDFLALPKIVRDLAEAQKESNERLSRIEASIAELTEAQKRTEQEVAQLLEAQKQADARLTRLEQAVAELTEAQKQADARLTRLEKAVAELTEAQKQADARLTRLEKAVAELTEAQKRTEQRVAELTEIAQRHEERLDKLTERVDRIEMRLAKVDGRTLELEYERKAGGYFGRIISNPQVVNLGVWEEELSPPLSEEEFEDVWRLDLILRGKLRAAPKGQPKSEAWLAIEISVLIDLEDVERVERRAGLLRKANLLALPVVAGEDITKRALQRAEERGVIVVRNGSIRFIEQALQRYA
ncbi:MAG: hypothetical protein Kow0088_18890 [Anaerolineales bacterium]